MRFPTHTILVRQTAFAVLLAAALAGCSKPKEKEARVQELPLLSSVEEVKAAVSKAGNRPLVIDFYADWCKPCRALAPVMRGLAVEHKGKTDFYRANIDNSPELAGAFGVRGIPYVVFMKNDTAVHALTGLNPKERYEEVLLICEGTASAGECVRRLNKGK